MISAVRCQDWKKRRQGSYWFYSPPGFFMSNMLNADDLLYPALWWGEKLRGKWKRLDIRCAAGNTSLLFHSCLATVSVDIEYQRVPRRWAREQIKSNRFLQVPTLAIKWEHQKQLEAGKCPVFSIKTQSDIEFLLFCPYHCMVYLRCNGTFGNKAHT